MSELVKELFSLKLHKNSQGRIVRKMTMLAIWILFAGGAYKFFQMPFGGIPLLSDMGLRGLVAGIFVLIGLWIGFRVTHLPGFADFLISVEAEMVKVSWPSYAEVYSSTIVVLIMFVILSMMIYVFDLVWVFIFRSIHVLS